MDIIKESFFVLIVSFIIAFIVCLSPLLYIETFTIINSLEICIGVSIGCAITNIYDNLKNK